MRPVLFEVFGLPIHSYGVSKAAAALVTGSLRGRPPAGAGSDEMVPGGTAGRDVVHYRR